jgi:hypothetical protein
LKDKTLFVELVGNISHGVMDIWGGETKTFQFQIQNSQLVLVEAKTIKWSNAAFSLFGRGNGRFDKFERYDFLKNKGSLTYTARENEESVVEKISKINDLIPFHLISNSFAELKTIANNKIEQKKDMRQNELIKIPFGIKKKLFDYQTDRNKTEEELVKGEISKQAKEIYRLGEADGFKCEENDFQITDWSNGVFIKTKAKPVKKKPAIFKIPITVAPQNAYLYRLCSSGKAQYSTNLGGIVITEKGKIKAHFFFSNVSGFERMNVLPDINQNGVSEIVLEFAHSINSLNFAQAIGIFEISEEGDFANLGETNVFQRLENQSADDISYTIFVKRGEKPEFYRETYGSNDQINDWAKIEVLTKFELNRNSAIKIQSLLRVN